MPAKYFENKPTAVVRMFCFPYAGGNAEFYLPWKSFIPDWIDLCPIQLAGRSYRLNETCKNNFYDLAEELLELIAGYTDKEAVFYGHSMGSVLAYEIAVRMKKKPILICLTGGDAPHEWKGKNFNTNLSDEEMLNWMTENYGYSAVGNQEIKKYLLPFVQTLRNDLQICEDYKPSGAVYNHPAIIGGSKDDPLCKSDLNLWKKYCPDSEVIYFENGGHFFNREHANELVSIITKKIKEAESLR
jgi:surfactin synthase thioesterase subunit